MSTFDDWIGRTRTETDILWAGTESRFRATLQGHLWENAEERHIIALGAHWCLAPPVEPLSNLGPDGHPARDMSEDSFLPPVPLPSRMWAGGSLRFLAPLPVDQPITRRSEILSITQKDGSSGALAIVEIAHDYATADAHCLEEKQTIVYKSARTPGDGPDYAPGQGGFDNVTLFRYSALTFNGHRIHYDADYARTQEHYPACVVHGPLQATLLLNHVARRLGHLPTSFSYRGQAPLFVQEPWQIEAGEGTARIVGPQGRVTTVARFT